MAKKKTSFALHPDVLVLLAKLAKRHDRSQASMLEVLVKAAAASQDITL